MFYVLYWVHLILRFHVSADTHLIRFVFSFTVTFSDCFHNRPRMPPSNSTSDKAANEPPSKSHVVWETFPTDRERVRIRVASDKTDKFVYKKRERGKTTCRRWLERQRRKTGRRAECRHKQGALAPITKQKNRTVNAKMKRGDLEATVPKDNKSAWC